MYILYVFLYISRNEQVLGPQVDKNIKNKGVKTYKE